MTAPVYRLFPRYLVHRVRPFRWAWEVTDGLTGPLLASGTTWTRGGAEVEAALTAALCRRQPAGVCRCDRDVLHPLTPGEAKHLTAELAADGVPVTVQLDRREHGPAEVVLWTALQLETWQQAHALRLVTRATDSRVHWAGAL
jgi:hypothetical protein